MDGSVNREENNLIPTITLYTNTEKYDPVRYYAAYDIANWWQELGLDVEVVPMEFLDLINESQIPETEERGWHAFILGQSGRIERADPDMFIYTFYHNARFGYRDAEYEALADAQRRVSDSGTRQRIVFAAQEILARDVPFLTLYYRHVVQAYRYDRWEHMTALAGEGIFHEWLPFYIYPKHDDGLNSISDLPVVIASNHEPESLNPLTAATVWEWKILRMFYDKLARVNLFFQPEPWAAQEIIQVDSLTVDVILRDDMTFHDGYPVRPEDVVFSYNFIRDTQIRYLSTFIDPIQEVVLLEDGTIRFILKEPFSAFYAMTLAQIPILPEHLWAPLRETFTEEIPKEMGQYPLVGSGPLVFTDWEPGKWLRFKKNHNHFAAEDISIETLIYRLYPDVEDIFTALLNGEADITGVNLEPDMIPRALDDENIQVVQVPDIGFVYLGFNCSVPPFDDPVMRQAAVMAIDLDAIVEKYLNNYGDIGGAGQPISPGNRFWKNPHVTRYSFDIEQARGMLKAAGYSWDNQGRIYLRK